VLTVEKVLHELGIGVKGQSNLEIAGSPRNSFRASLESLPGGGRALDSVGPATRAPNLTKLRIPLGISLESVHEG
jgi:hypothetical protein